MWERLRPERDDTAINQQTHYVDMLYPDGKPEILQQTEELKATIELLIITGEEKYVARMRELQEELSTQFGSYVVNIIQVIPAYGRGF